MTAPPQFVSQAAQLGLDLPSDRNDPRLAARDVDG